MLILIWPALGPSSLWVDDAWQALVWKAHSLRELRLVALTSPGFAVILKGWFSIAGFSELNAQMPSVVFGVVLPGATYLVARTWRISRLPALVAGVVLMTSPGLLESVPRVKQFSMNALLSLVLIHLGWRVVDSGGSRGRWGVLLLAAVLATAASGTVAPVAGGSILIGAVVAWRRGHGNRQRGLLTLALFAVFSAGWWLLYLRGAVVPALTEFWDTAYIDTANLGVFVGGMAIALLRLVARFLVLPLWVSVGGVLVSGYVLLKREAARWFLLSTPVAIAVLLASLRLSPLGTGRTDTYLYPGMSLGIAAAISVGVGDRVKTNVIAGLSVALVLIASLFAPRSEYPLEDVRPLVDAVDALPPTNRVIVYPITQYPAALYTTKMVSFLEDPSSPNGFDVRIPDSAVVILSQHLQQPDLYRAELEAATQGQDAVWFLASHFWPDLEVIQAQLRQIGFVPVDEWNRQGASLTRWERQTANQ